MNRYLKIGLYIVAMLLLFWVSYVLKFSMGTSEEYEVTVSENAPSILIATQQSEYKDEVTKKVVDYFKHYDLNIKVIDISNLGKINEEDYTSIAVIHTWEYSKPPQEVKNFIQIVKDKDKVFTLSTSGDGNYRSEEVDGISAASRMLSSESDSESIINWIKSRLKPTP